MGLVVYAKIVKNSHMSSQALEFIIYVPRIRIGVVMEFESKFW